MDRKLNAQAGIRQVPVFRAEFKPGCRNCGTPNPKGLCICERCQQPLPGITEIRAGDVKATGLPGLLLWLASKLDQFANWLEKDRTS